MLLDEDNLNNSDKKNIIRIKNRKLSNKSINLK